MLTDLKLNILHNFTQSYGRMQCSAVIVFLQRISYEKKIIIIIFVVFLQSQSNTKAAELLRLLDELALSFAKNSANNIIKLSDLSEFV